MSRPLILESTSPNAISLTVCRPERFNGLGTSIGEELLEKLQNIATRSSQKSVVTEQDDKSSQLAHNQTTAQRPHPEQVPPSDANATGILPVLILRAKPRQTSKDRVWIAGGDLKELAQLGKDQAFEYCRIWTQIGVQLMTYPGPVITAMDGLAIGGGAELALFGDIRFGTKSTRFHFKQLEMGLITGYGGGERLVQLVGTAIAQKWLYLGELISTEELLRYAILHRVFESSHELDDGIDAITKKLTSYHNESFAMQKYILGSSPTKSKEQIFASIWKNPKHKKGLESYNKTKFERISPSI